MGMPRIKAVIDYGNPGFQEALLPLLQQVPGRALGDLLVARGIGFLASRHIQGVEQGDLAYSFGRQTLHIFSRPATAISEKSVGKRTWRRSSSRSGDLARARLPGPF